jgi:hypothetical protein
VALAVIGTLNITHMACRLAIEANNARLNLK